MSLDTMNVQQLRARCGMEGLKSTGKKAELLLRLKNHLKKSSNNKNNNKLGTNGKKKSINKKRKSNINNEIKIKPNQDTINEIRKLEQELGKTQETTQINNNTSINFDDIDGDGDSDGSVVIAKDKDVGNIGADESSDDDDDDSDDDNGRQTHRVRGQSRSDQLNNVNLSSINNDAEWIMLPDPNTGKYYFANTKTGKRQWERPKDFAQDINAFNNNNNKKRGSNNNPNNLSNQQQMNPQQLYQMNNNNWVMNSFRNMAMFQQQGMYPGINGINNMYGGMGNIGSSPNLPPYTKNVMNNGNINGKSPEEIEKN